MAQNNFGYVDSHYLRVAQELFNPIKQRSYALMGKLDGKHILDMGCGPGLDTIALAQQVTAKGTVTGIDHDAEMLRHADTLAVEHNCADCVSHHVADATNLPFKNNQFDAVRSERMFMHLQDAGKALTEALRVTRAGGRVVVVDTDWGSLSAHTEADDLERSLAQFRTQKFLPNGYSGRRLPGMFNAIGFEQVRLEAVTLQTCDLNLWLLMTRSEEVAEVAVQQGAWNENDRQRWNHSLQNTAKNGAFFGSVCIVTVSAQVPA